MDDSEADHNEMGIWNWLSLGKKKCSKELREGFVQNRRETEEEKHCNVTPDYYFLYTQNDQSFGMLNEKRIPKIPKFRFVKSFIE